MSQKSLDAAIAARMNISKAEADRFMTALIESIEEHLRENSKLKIPNLAIFKVIQKPGRNYRNPKTQEAVWKEPTKVVKIRPWKNLRDLVS